MKPCLQAILKLPEEDQEAFAANMERAIRLGAGQEDARQEAARMLLESIDAQTNEAIAEFKKQHPDALEKPAKTYDYDAALAIKWERMRRFHAERDGLVDRINADAEAGIEEASILRIITRTGFRIGGDGVSAGAPTFGASSLRPEHIKIYGDTISFTFRGKSGVTQQHSIVDGSIARDLERRMGGEKLFTKGDRAVRRYHDSIQNGGDYKVHDHRTWAATIEAMRVVEQTANPETEKQLQQAIARAGDAAAVKIGDDRATALKSYVDPQIFDPWRQALGLGQQVPAESGKGRGRGQKAADGSGAEGSGGQDLRPDQGLKSSRAEQTETPAFKRWFGDSKVVDAEGKPLVVYHGTSKDIASFDPAMSADGVFHFAADSSKAGRFAMSRSMDGGRGANVMPVYLMLRNPKRVTFVNSAEIEAARREGHDGLISERDGHYVAFRPEQIKSATGNNGQYDPANPDIRASRSPQGFELEEMSKLRETQTALQDRYNRWKMAIDAVRAQGGNITEANDFYQAEERYWGRVASRNDDFGKEIEAFVEAVQADGLTLQDVAEYAYAKHAEERNAYVAKMRDDMQGAGSGMTDEEAESILMSAEQSGLEPLLEKHAETLYDWMAGTRDVLESEGLISAEERATWDGMFRHYVPLRGLEGVEAKKGTGSGFNIRGRESKSITGRRSQAKQIIEQIIQDRTKAYIRAGKNEVLRSFLTFALDNPSPNLWAVNRVETKPVVVVDEFGNRMVEQRDSIVSDDRTVAVKDGGRTIHIEIKDKSLREQMQNLHIESVNKLVAAMLWANRKVGAMLTAYNPVFVVMNGIRDYQAASFGLLDEIGFHAAANLAREYGPAFAEARRAQFGKASPEYEEYVKAGGTTGYFGLKDLDTTGKELQALMRNAERSIVNPIKMAKGVASFVDKSNNTVEQATRYAAYRVARKSGKSIAESASISKNITVNFNRKGTMASTLGAFILFYNPAVQGTARLAQALKSPKVLGALAGAATGLFFLALSNAASGGDDEDGVPFWDKVPKEVKERNIVIMLPPKRNKDGKLESDYIKIPVAYGYNFFNVLANEAADQWRRTARPEVARPPTESAVRLAQVMLGSVMPVSAIGQSLDDTSALVMAPYSNALGPIAQALANRSGFGRPLHPELPTEKWMPDSTKYTAAQAGTVWQKTTEKLNEWTGGSKYEQGLIDISPGALENATRFYGGGIATFTLDVLNAFYARQHIDRPVPDLKRLPFAKQLTGTIDDETDRWFGYERMNKADKAIQPWEQASKKGDTGAMERLEGKSGDLVYLGGALRNMRQELSQLRKEERRVIEDDEMTDSKKFAELTQLSSRNREALQRWNALYADFAKQKDGQ